MSLPRRGDLLEIVFVSSSKQREVCKMKYVGEEKDGYWWQGVGGKLEEAP